MSQSIPNAFIRIGLCCITSIGLASCGSDSSAGESSVTVSSAENSSQSSLNPSYQRFPLPSDPGLGDELSALFGLIRERRLPEARAGLEAYLTLHPDDAKAEFLLGLSWHREKVYGKARPLFEQAIEHDPGYYTTYYFLGWSLYYLGEPKPAHDAFLAHIHYQPEEGDSHFALGLIAFENGQIDEAERYFHQAIDLQVNNPARHQEIAKARAALADVYVQRGQLEDARRELVIATDLWPDAYEAHFKLYRVLLQLGEEGAAEYALQKHNEAKERLRPGTSFPE